MDGVGTPIIERPRPLPGHDTPNPAYHPHTLNYEEPVIARSFLYPGFTVLVFAVLLGKKTLIVTIFLAKVSFVLISVFAV